jgi:hypothetical protein
MHEARNVVIRMQRIGQLNFFDVIGSHPVYSALNG